MSDLLWSTLIAGFFTLLGIFYQNEDAKRKLKAKRQAREAEKEAIRADIAAQYQAIAFNAEKRYAEFEKRVNAEIADLKNEIEKRDAVIDDLQDWIKRLVVQVRESGQEPVKMRKRV